MPQQSRTISAPETTGPTTPTPTTAPAVRQPAGNAAAVERAGLTAPAAGFLGGWDDLTAAARDALGLDDGETEDAWALAKQTAGNIQSAHGKLGEMAEQARLVGLDEVGARLEGAAAKLAKVAGLSEQLGTAMGVGEDLALVKQLYETTSAVLAVDMRAPEAAATFDAWFATVGKVGGILLAKGGAWGAVLAPFAEFVALLGASGFFAKVRENMGMHGGRGVNGRTIDALEKEGF